MGLLAQRLAATAAGQGPAAIAPIPDYTSGVTFDDRTGTGLLGFLGNIGADARDIALGLGRLGGLAAGDLFVDIPTGNWSNVDVLTPAFGVDMVKAFGSDLADRYGKPGEIPSEFYDHPLSFVADALTLAGGAGAAARAATGVGRWGDIAARSGIQALSREAQLARAAEVMALRGTRGALAEAAIPRTLGLADDASRLSKVRAGLMDFATGRQMPVPQIGPVLSDGSFTSVSKLMDATQAVPTEIKVLDRLLPAGNRWIPRHQTIFGKSREGFDWIETRTAEATSGYTRGLWGSRNPLVQAVWTNPIQRRILTQSRGRFAMELADLERKAAMGEKVSPYEIDKMKAALTRMEAGGAERVSRYGLYGSALVKTDVDRWIGRLMTEGIIKRRDQAEQMRGIMAGVEGAETFHSVIQGLSGDQKLAVIPDDLLGPSLAAKGYEGVDAFERAARDVLYDTEAGALFSVDEKATLIDKVLRGDVSLPEAYKLTDPDWAATPDLAPERTRFREELRAVGDQVGMPQSQQDFFIASTDSMARALVEHNPERFTSPDQVYGMMRLEFKQKWIDGIENSLQQRVARLYRGAVKYVDGKPQVDAARLAKWFWKGVDENPELLDWYSNGSSLIAELTQGLTTTFRNADGEIIETIDDYELLTDLLAAHSLGSNVTRNFAEAWEVYTRFKTGRIHLEYSDFEGWTPESKQLQNLKTVKVRARPLLDWVARQGMPWDKNSNEARYFYRAMEMGELSVDQADKLAASLGVHPYRIWGDEFYQDITVRGASKIRAFDPDGNEIRGLFGGGKSSQAKARIVKEILEGHLIRHWEQEISEGTIRDIPVEEAMKRFEHRTRGLGLNSRQKVRAFAASLKLDGNRAAVDRRMGMLFGIFTGNQQWARAVGTYPDGTAIPPKFARKTLTGSDYGQVERWLREVQGHINRHLPAGSAPYSLAQVQAVLWGQAVGFVNAEANRVAKLIRRGIDTDGSPLTDQSLTALEEYHRLLRAAVTTEGQSIEDYTDAWLKLRDGPMGETLVQQMRSRFGDTNVRLAQKVTDLVKGQIIFGTDFPSTIQLFAEGDFTTLVHERAHLLRRLLPDTEVRGLWDSYRRIVHGDSPIPDDGGVPLKQTVRSREPIGAFAAVDAPGGEIAEGQFVNVNGETVRVVRLYQKGDRYYAEVQNHLKGTVKRDVPVDDLAIVPELDPYTYGLTDPMGVPPVAGGKVGVVKGGGGGNVAFGTGEGARYGSYFGKKGTLTAANADKPFFAYDEAGKAARKAWETAHKDDVLEIRAAVKVDTTGGKARYEIVPIAKGRDGKWVEARTLAGDPVPQPRPEPTDITPTPVYREVVPVTEGASELVRQIGADPVAQDLLRHFQSEETLEKWVEKNPEMKFTTIGESPGYFLIHQTNGVEGDKGNFYVVNKGLWDDPNAKLSPDEHLLRDERTGQSSFDKRPQAPDQARWAKPGAPSLKKLPQGPAPRPKAKPKPEPAPVPTRGGGEAALVEDLKDEGIGRIVAEAEVPTDIIDKAQEEFYARAQVGEGVEAIGVDEVDLPEGWYISKLTQTPDSEGLPGGPYYDLHIDQDVPVGTKVVFEGEWYGQAEYAEVELLDPKDVLLGNEIISSKLKSLGQDQGRGMPVAMVQGDLVIAFEGNHRVYVARQKGDPIKVAVMRGKRVVDELGPLEPEAPEAGWVAPKSIEVADIRSGKKLKRSRAAFGKGDIYEYEGQLYFVADKGEPAWIRLNDNPAWARKALGDTEADKHGISKAKPDVMDVDVEGGRDVQAEQAARGGLSDAEEAAAQDAFAAKLAAMAEEPKAETVTLAGTDWTTGESVQVTNKDGSLDSGTIESFVPEQNIIRVRVGDEVINKYAGVVKKSGARAATRPAGVESPGAQAAAPGTPGPPPSGPPPGTPPTSGNDMPWSVAMEEAFAEDMERWIFNQLLPTDERIHPAFRTLASSLRELWQKIRGFALERQMIPEPSAQTFDRYFGKAFTDAATPDPGMTAGMKRRTRALANVPVLDHPAVGAQVAQMEGDAATLQHAARSAQPLLRRKLAAVFQRTEFDTQAKNIARIGQKLRDGVPVTDALQARVRIDTWVNVRDAISKIEAAGLRILGIEDTLATPGPFGSRAMRVLVEDPDAPGFVSEIEIGTPFFERFRRATFKHEQTARQLPIEISRLEQRLADLDEQMANIAATGDPETDAPILRSLEKQQAQALEKHAELTEQLQAAERIMEGLYESVVDEIDGHHGGVLPGGTERRAIDELRLWNAEHVEQPMLDSGYADFRYMFDRLFYPIRKKAGAVFQQTDAHPEGEWVGGGDPYALDAARAAEGLPQPVYFPHMKPPPKLSDWVLQRGKNMFGARKLAENKNLKRWHGELMPEDMFGDPGYLTDIELAYELRAARAIKMHDTQRLVNWVTQNFGRKIADPHALGAGEVLYAPDFINALFRAVVTIEDQMGTLLANLPTDLLIGADFTKREGAEAAFSIIEQGLRKQGVQEIQAGALLQALDDVMPQVKREFIALTSKGIDYYAIPKVVAKRLEQSVNGPLGLAGNKSLRLFWDSPTNLWRALVLYGRPAWLVNNFFGNLLFLKVQGGRFSDVVRQRFDPEFKDMLQQIAREVPGTEVGFFTSTAEQYTPHLGGAGEDAIGEMMAATKVAARQSRVLRPTYKFGDFMKSLNEDIENYFRRAGMYRAVETEINPEHIRSLGRRFWADKKEMEKVLVDGIPDQAVERILDKVNTFFGDFSQMSPAGRHIVRRFMFPFWGFYRHVMKLFLQLPSEYPGRFTLMRMIEQATEDMVAEYGPLPEWMGGMATLGGEPQSEGDTRFVSMAGPNPFNVLTDDVVSMLHPAVKLMMERATGQDSFTGRPFSSPDVVTPYGSDQQFQIVRDANGMPIEAQPVDKVVPPWGVHVLSQIPQYDLIRNLLAGGRTYDTEGILASMTGGPVIDSQGQVVRPIGPVETASKYLGFSTFPFDVPSYQERLGQERENALSYALKQWQAEQGGQG